MSYKNVLLKWKQKISEHERNVFNELNNCIINIYCFITFFVSYIAGIWLLHIILLFIKYGFTIIIQPLPIPNQTSYVFAFIDFAVIFVSAITSLHILHNEFFFILEQWSQSYFNKVFILLSDVCFCYSNYYSFRQIPVVH